MNPKKIVIDGKTYNSPDEMPEEVRRNYEDAMTNFGAPDRIENQQVINLSGGMKFVVGGQTYNSVDELPPDARAKYEQALGSMDTNRNGMPDFLEGMTNVSHQHSQPAMTSTRHSTDTTRHASRAPMPVSPALAPDTSNGWMLALAGLFLLLICAVGAIGVWYFLIR